MSSELHNHQRRLIAGVAILVVLFLLVLVAIFQSVRHPVSDPQIGYRSPATRLTYCAPEDNSRLCVVSFGQIESGDMLVNFQAPRLLYPEFTLIINRYGVESIYECNRAKGLSIAVTCTGPSQDPGEILQFKVFSIEDGILLAEGKFAIIGIALSTPEILTTGTPGLTGTVEPSVVPEASSTPEIPTPVLLTPTPPNPSYPNPTTYP